MTTKIYCPLSLLSHISISSKKILFNQINYHTKPYFSDLVTGFRRKRSTQYCLIIMQGKRENRVNNRYHSGPVFVDFLKTFICIRVLHL